MYHVFFKEAANIFFFFSNRMWIFQLNDISMVVIGVVLQS